MKIRSQPATSATARSPVRTPVHFQRWLKNWLGLWASGVLLIGVLLAVDSRAVLAHLQQADVRWLFVSLAVSLPQVLALGLRWAHISQGLGVPLGRATAIREYAIGIALNQSLPTGVAGDAMRAFRHGRSVHSLTKAGPSSGSSGTGITEIATRTIHPQSLYALLLDRLSGQVALLSLGVCALGLAVSQDVVPLRFLQSLSGAALVLGLGAYVAHHWTHRFPKVSRLRAFLSRGCRVLFMPRSFVTHFLLSMVFLACTLAQYWAAGRAAGVTLETAQLVWFGTALLLATSIPSFFAGFGVREGASAVLFTMAGLSASDGVATALMFGIFSLVIGWCNALAALIWMMSVRRPLHE